MPAPWGNHQEQQQQRSGDGWSLEAKLYAPEGRAGQVTQADPVGSTEQSYHRVKQLIQGRRKAQDQSPLSDALDPTPKQDNLSKSRINDL